MSRTGHPPVASWATSRERSIIEQLHRAATIQHDDEPPNPARRIMLEAVDLIVTLIGQRARGRAFYRNLDDQEAESG